MSSINLESAIPNASSGAIDLMVNMLKWNPSNRPTVTQSFRYSYFKVNQKLGLQQMTSLSTTRSSSHRPSNYFKLSSNKWDDNGNKRLIGEINDDRVGDRSNFPNQGTRYKEMTIERPKSPEINSLMNNTSDNTNQISSQSKRYSGISLKDQYLIRSRYIAGQNTKNLSYRGGNWTFSDTLRTF